MYILVDVWSEWPYNIHILLIKTRENKMTETQQKTFINYCYEFYGIGGIYDLGVTMQDVADAVALYKVKCNRYPEMWGDGDSVDRERVRDILVALFHNKEFA
jgi:hypothetical protein